MRCGLYAGLAWLNSGLRAGLSGGLGSGNVGLMGGYRCGDGLTDAEGAELGSSEGCGWAEGSVVG